jgi:Tol biopolymer transport system component
MTRKITIITLAAIALGAGIILRQTGKTGAVSAAAKRRAPGRASERELLPREGSPVPGNRAQGPSPRVSTEGPRARRGAAAVRGRPTPPPPPPPPTEELREALDIPSPPGISLAGAALSPSGEKLLFGNASGCGLAIHDMASDSTLVVSSAPGSGYGASWSPRGDRVAYKEVDIPSGEENAVVYDTGTGTATALSKEARQCGTPVFSPGGPVGFAAGDAIYIYDENLVFRKKIAIDEHVRQMAFSPDGERVGVVTDSGLFLVDAEGGGKKEIARTSADYLQPLFSPDGKRIALGTSSADLHIADVASGDIWNAGRGECPQWLSDGTRVIFLRNRRLLIDGVNGSEIVIADAARRTERTLFETKGGILSGLSVSPGEKKASCISADGKTVKIFSLAR